MKILPVSSWADCKALFDTFAAPKCSILGATKGPVSQILYRGQSDSEWKLQSTLERKGKPECLLFDYLLLCTSARRSISNFEQRSIPYNEDAKSEYELASRGLPNYEYMAFLRHHGFPSPLLDWTQSPYVAAFFAFHGVVDEDGDVAVFVYQEQSGGGKVFDFTSPSVFVSGPFAGIHERHAMQQCWYTYCMQATGIGEAQFTRHEAALALAHSKPSSTQDALIKIVIPKAQSKVAMQDLRKMNITPYTLFRSIDALIETVAQDFFA